MKQGALEKKVAMLPDALRLKAEGYIDALLSENNIHAEGKSLHFYPVADDNVGVFTLQEPYQSFQQQPKLKREFGGLKGFVKYMADDFDAPMDDFKDYM